MKHVLIAGMIMLSLVACGDNGTTNAGDATPDSAYNNSVTTDTGTEKLDSTNVKAGAGQGTGSAAQASQDTGKGEK